MSCRVEISAKVRKNLKHIPKYIVANLLDWVIEIEAKGVEEVRKIPGYHDEPLKGIWHGYRSIRLSQSYRAIYRLMEGEIRIVTIIGVSKHEY